MRSSLLWGAISWGKGEMSAGRKQFVLFDRDVSGQGGGSAELDALINVVGSGASSFALSHAFASGMSSMSARPQMSKSSSKDDDRIQVLDTLGGIDAALVEITEAQARDLAELLPNVIIGEAVTLYPMRASPAQLISKTVRRNPVPTGRTLRVLVRDSQTGLPIAGADVTLAIDLIRGWGYPHLVTGTDGTVTVPLPKKVRMVDGIFVHPLRGYWPARHLDVQTTRVGETEVAVTCEPIAPSWQDSLSKMISAPTENAGKGVRVAVVDTGVTPGPGLVVRGGLNTTNTEPEELWQDRGDGHGTHVAGIISRIAPAVEIMAYRVFTAAKAGATEVSIARAIRQAVADGCDIINLSLGQGKTPLVVMREVARARDNGVLCIAAAGNDYMSSVKWPARGEEVLAVSACGLAGTWPPLASTGDAVADSPSEINGVFFARFSNVGREIDLTAPGVGIISKVTADAVGVMDGTSMACPSVVAQLARLLSERYDLLTMKRDSARSAGMVQLAMGAAAQLGFGAQFEGRGRLP